MRELHELWLRRAAAVVSIASFLTWGRLVLQALSHPESQTASGWRTLAFVAAIDAGTVAWPIKPRKGDDDESF